MPLIAAIPKMFFPFLVILPGLIAISVPTVQDHLTGEATTVSRAAPQSNTSAAIAQTTEAKGDVRAGMTEGRGLIPVKVNAITGQPVVDQDGKPVLNYDLAIPNMLLRYFPTGHAGAGADRAAGELHVRHGGQRHRVQHGVDLRHLSVVHPASTSGRALPMDGARGDRGRDTAVDWRGLHGDELQQHHGRAAAGLRVRECAAVRDVSRWGCSGSARPGMRRFPGLLAGVLAGLAHIGLTLPAGEGVSVKGGWLGVVHHYPSEMAQNFWTAIWAFVVCMIVTLVVSMLTRPREERELVGLVYSLTPKPDEQSLPWWKRPVTLAVVVLAMAVALNLIFA